MLVLIRAISEKQTEQWVGNYYINPEHISSAYISNDGKILHISMKDGEQFAVHFPRWIEAAAEKSPEINLLYQQFIEKKEREEAINQLIDKFAENYNVIDIPDEWQQH